MPYRIGTEEPIGKWTMRELLQNNLFAQSSRYVYGFIVGKSNRYVVNALRVSILDEYLHFAGGSKANIFIEVHLLGGKGILLGKAGCVVSDNGRRGGGREKVGAGLREKVFHAIRHWRSKVPVSWLVGLGRRE